MIDITYPIDFVEVLVDSTGKLWVNVDGKCALRISHCRLIEIDDPIRGRDIVHRPYNEDE